MRDVLIFLVALFVFIVGLCVYFAGPCELYRFSNAGDVPARCLMDGE